MTDREKVRLLIGDFTEPYHFSNDQIDAFLSIASSVYLAAALALEAWAAALTDNAESEKIGDYAYTKKQVSNKLALAKRYREDEATEPCSDWAEMDLVSYGEEDEL